MAPGAAGGSARGRAAALRRTAFSGDDGPIERPAQRGVGARSGATSPASGRGNPFDRKQEINDTIAVLRETAELHAAAIVAQRSAVHEHRTGAAPRRRDRAAAGVRRSGGADYDGWEAGLVDLSRRSRARKRPARPRRDMQDGVPRDTVLTAVEAALAAGPVPHGGGRRSRGAPAARTARRDCALRAAESGRGALDFLDLLVRARSGARQSARPPRLPGAVHAHLRRRVPGHRSAAGGDPAAARRRRRRRDRLAPGPAGARPAVSRRRSETVDLPVPPRRRRHLPRGVAAARRTGRACCS